MPTTKRRPGRPQVDPVGKKRTITIRLTPAALARVEKFRNDQGFFRPSYSAAIDRLIMMSEIPDDAKKGHPEKNS